METEERDKIMPGHLYSLEKAAPFLDGRSTEAIRKLIKRNRLAGEKGRDGCWRVRGSELIAYKSGGPPKL